MTKLDDEKPTPTVEDEAPLAVHAHNREINKTSKLNLGNKGSCKGLTGPKVDIDLEIQSLIPPLRPDELAKLRDSIKTEGCRDPLVLWKGHDVLLDGHNRYAICRELGKPFTVREMEFPNKDHAKLWIIKNQLGRRNLTDTQFNLMVGMEYELEKKVSWGGDRKSQDARDDQLPQSEGVYVWNKISNPELKLF